MASEPVRARGRYHAYPYDNWRFYPDAGLALEAWAAKQGLGLTLVESFTARQKRDVWNDFVMVFTKRDGSPPNPATFLADHFADAFNIRRGSDAKIGNFSRQPEDGLIRARLEQERDDLRRTLDICTAEVRAQKKLTARLQARLARVYASRSWRITAPLRAMTAGYRRLVRSIRRRLGQADLPGGR